MQAPIPVALDAPALCPRCDAPAARPGGSKGAYQCAQCSLPLRWCGACRGVAGPFDRFCGFCGAELAPVARRRSPTLFWLLAVAIPVLAGLGYGVWAARVPADVAAALQPAPRPSATDTPGQMLLSPELGVRYTSPHAWTVVDYGVGANPQALVTMSRATTDQPLGPASWGDLAAAGESQTDVITLSRPDDVTGDDPVTALTAEVAAVVANSPPDGTSVGVLWPPHAVRIGGRPGAEAILRLARPDGSISYLRRTLVLAPRPGLSPLLRIDALVPLDTFPEDDSGVTLPVLDSIRFL